MNTSKDRRNIIDVLVTPFKQLAFKLSTVIECFINFIIYSTMKPLYCNSIMSSSQSNEKRARENYVMMAAPPTIGTNPQPPVMPTGGNNNNKNEDLKIETGFEETNKSSIKNPNEKHKPKRNNSRRVPKISEKTKQKLEAERTELLKVISAGEERYDKPQTFRYKALSPEGRIVQDTFIGVSKLDIYTFLTGEGFTVYKIETSDMINLLYGQSKASYRKLSTKNLIFFITQLETYIKSGITLTEAMRILSKQLKKDRNQHRITESIVYYLTMGESFSNALEKQTGAFPPLVINMIKAAEAAGNLDETLGDLRVYYEEINSTHKQMISALTYPAVVGLFSIVVIVFIMVYIVPQFVGIYESAGAELNPLTIFVINTSNFLSENILMIAIVLVVLVILILAGYKYLQPFRREMQVLLMHMPIVSQIMIYNELTIFTKTFASLLRNDVYITESLEILTKITNNEIYKEIMYDTIDNITRGEKISESFKDHWAIPDIAYYMVVTGENTGQLASMMSKVSSYYQEQHKAIVNSLKALIEPILIITLAVIVGGVLIAVVVPMFNLYGNIA